MKRAILAPATLPASALDELKQWLGITVAADDALLTNLLRAALDTCEAFTHAMPLEQTCEEEWPGDGRWRALVTRPVLAITRIDAVAADGIRTMLAEADYEIELDADGTGRFRIAAARPERRFVVRFDAGLAADWGALPEPLKHGMVRLAAHQHRERESAGAGPLPPASVAALWHPWRRMRLA